MKGVPEQDTRHWAAVEFHDASVQVISSLAYGQIKRGDAQNIRADANTVLELVTQILDEREDDE